ncbi:MAG TPA: hypothetical protein VMZ11_05720 [Mycobacteriales bacterium]|nr:hypothetical protein [Mycobacteriales bacterium]
MPTQDRSTPPALSRAQAVLILLVGLTSSAVGTWAVWDADVPQWFSVLVAVLPVLLAVLVVRFSYRPHS